MNPDWLISLNRHHLPRRAGSGKREEDVGLVSDKKCADAESGRGKDQWNQKADDRSNHWGRRPPCRVWIAYADMLRHPSLLKSA